MKHDLHFNHQTDLPLNLQILNISVNLARVSQWIVNDKLDLVKKTLQQTESYLNDLRNQNLSKQFQPTIEKFTEEFTKLRSQRLTRQNKLEWAERALTWANILQHRAKLA